MAREMQNCIADTGERRKVGDSYGYDDRAGEHHAGPTRNIRAYPGRGKKDRQYFNRQLPFPGYVSGGQKTADTVYSDDVFLSL